MKTSTFIKEYPALSKTICKSLVNVFDKNSEKYAQDGRILTADGESVANPWLKRCKEFELANFEKDDLLKYNTLDDALTKSLSHYFWKYAEEHPYTLKNVVSQNKVKITKYKLRKYDIGDFFNWHIDQLGIVQATRVLACIVYLNDVEEGGETIIQISGEEKEYTCKPEVGKLLIFPAHWIFRHKSNTVVSEPKYVITCFINIY
tara:strand:- start:137 stop:748 length:612 start_codon:yes stop_codon:yes gene_type:complete